MALEGHCESVRAAAFSTDGRWVASGDDDGNVRIWDAMDGHLIAQLPHAIKIGAICFSPDGDWLATAGGITFSLGETHIWRLNGHAIEPTRILRHRNKVSDLSFSPSGRYLAITDDFITGDVCIWDSEKPEDPLTIRSLSMHLTSLDFTTDDSRLVTGSGDGAIKFWELSTQRLLGTLQTGEQICKVRLLDNDHLLTGSVDGWARIWSATSVP
jgi:WD40 repeat protein